MKPYLGQTVQYAYKPNSEPLAAIVTAVHDPEWVSLYLLSEVPRWLPHVEFAEHCKPIAPEPVPVNIYGGLFA